MSIRSADMLENAKTGVYGSLHQTGVILPLLILVGLPAFLWAAHSAPFLHLLDAWRYLIWVLPDVGWTLFGIAVALLAIGAVRLVWWMQARRTPRPQPQALAGA